MDSINKMHLIWVFGSIIELHIASKLRKRSMSQELYFKVIFLRVLIRISLKEPGVSSLTSRKHALPYEVYFGLDVMLSID